MCTRYAHRVCVLHITSVYPWKYSDHIVYARSNVTLSLIGWVHTQNDPWIYNCFISWSFFINHVYITHDLCVYPVMCSCKCVFCFLHVFHHVVYIICIYIHMHRAMFDLIKLLKSWNFYCIEVISVRPGYHMHFRVKHGRNFRTASREIYLDSSGG